MMNTMRKKSPNQVSPIPRRNNEARDEEIDNENGIIYPPEYSVARPTPMNDPNSLPLVSAVLIEEHNAHSAGKKRSRFNPFRPVHPQCNHISYGCLTMVFIAFVGMAVLLKTRLPDIIPPVIPSIDDEDLKSYDSYQPSPYPSIAKFEESTEPTTSPSFLPTVIRSNPPSMYLSHPPSITKYEEKKLVASDGFDDDRFGATCSMANDLVLIGATGADENKGAAYLFHLGGTEVMKLTPGNEGEEKIYFGNSISMDEKIVVGTWNADYVDVFSRQGIYERSIRCDDCNWLGDDVATHGNVIVMKVSQNSTWKLFVFSTEGQLLKVLEPEDYIHDIAMSEKYIVST